MNQKLRHRMTLTGQTIAEEIANAITHGVGTALSIVGLTLLLVFAIMEGDRWRIVSFSIYGGSLVFLYLASTLYHSFFFSRLLNRVFLTFDHIGIFFLIAGTYTPFLLVKLRGHGGVTFLIIIWSIAIVGAILKAFFAGRYTRLTVLLYVGMGWMGLLMAPQIMDQVQTGGLVLTAAGGGLYTLGVIPFLWQRLPFNHTIWHLFVMGGSASHFFAHFFYVLPTG